MAEPTMKSSISSGLIPTRFTSSGISLASMVSDLILKNQSRGRVVRPGAELGRSQESGDDYLFHRYVPPLKMA